MISVELAAKYHLPPIEEYPFPEIDWYTTFLKATDYIICKLVEASYLGEKLEKDYTELIKARRYARDMVNKLSKGDSK